jgi:hypothetical protein
MHEPLFERIGVLERRVQRWRLVSLALALLFVSSLAINGTVAIVMVLSGDRRQELEIARMQAEMERERAEVARRQAEQVERMMIEQHKRQAQPDGPNP